MSAYSGAVRIQDKHGRDLQAFTVVVLDGGRLGRMGYVTLTAHDEHSARRRVCSGHVGRSVLDVWAASRSEGAPMAG